MTGVSAKHCISLCMWRCYAQNKIYSEKSSAKNVSFQVYIRLGSHMLAQIIMGQDFPEHFLSINLYIFDKQKFECLYYLSEWIFIFVCLTVNGNFANIFSGRFLYILFIYRETWLLGYTYIFICVQCKSDLNRALYMFLVSDGG